MNKQEWVRIHANRICEAIMEDHKQLGHLYCKAYEIDNGRFTIFADECEGWLTLGLGCYKIVDVIDKTQSLINYPDIYEALSFLLDWVEEEELC